MKHYLTIAALLVAFGCAAAWRASAVREGQAIEQQRVADSLLVVARADVQRLESRYRVDTLRLTKWRTKLDTLRDSLTVTDTVEVLRYVAVADSTIKSCTLALSTCERRIAAERVVSQSWEVKFRAERAMRPSLLQTWIPRVAAFGLGYVAASHAPH